MSSNAHVPVLLGPVLQGLKIKPDGVYVDATFGRGGHSRAILNELGAEGRLVAIDRDPEAIAAASSSLTNDSRFELIKGEFAHMAKLMAESTAGKGGTEAIVDGVLLDLGVSSPQLDDAERGFSFLRDGPLDMRMDPNRGQSAAEWLARVDEKELRSVLRRYGDETATKAAKHARAIVAARDNEPIQTTGRLASILAENVRPQAQKRHPATKTFQAIRIFINDELEQLSAALEQALALLKKGGRLCVLSFHSLEDRIVKRFMRDHARVPEPYRGMPHVPPQFQPKLQLIGKPVSADDAEVSRNVRSRSARLRVAEKAR